MQGVLLTHRGEVTVSVRHVGCDNFEAWYEGRWRKIHVHEWCNYIVYMYNKIEIVVDGV